LGERSTLHGYLPRLVKLLPAMLVPGQNKLDILSARNGTQTAVREVYFGSAARLEPAYRHSQAVIHTVGETTALAAGIVMLFSLALSPLIRKPALMASIAVALALFLLRELHTLWIDRPWPQTYRDIALLVVASWLWVANAAFVNEWTNGAAWYRRWLLAIGTGAGVLILGFYAILEDCGDAYVYSAQLQSLLGVTALMFIAQRLTRHYWTAPASAWPEVMIATVGLTMAFAVVVTQSLFIPGLSSWTSIHGEAFPKLSALSIILFIAIGLARHGIGIYQLAALNNETLAQKVDEKEREIVANHALLRDRDRERALHAERARIMRDVHDGIGSQLLGLLVQARAREPKGAAITGGLQEAIDDLYLVVDSLDGIDGSLETALGTFRSRIEPKCTAAGIAIDWQVESIGETKSIGPAAVLQIYRILQEAVSNAIRHGRPKRLACQLRQGAVPDTIEITLSDDGPGFNSSSAGGSGRGLANMRRRAEAIGAKLSIESSATGARVALTLPR
jgi:signal transduction histidine kinase